MILSPIIQYDTTSTTLSSSSSSSSSSGTCNNNKIITTNNNNEKYDGVTKYNDTPTVSSSSSSSSSSTSYLIDDDNDNDDDDFGNNTKCYQQTTYNSDDDDDDDDNFFNAEDDDDNDDDDTDYNYYDVDDSDHAVVMNHTDIIQPTLSAIVEDNNNDDDDDDDEADDDNDRKEEEDNDNEQDSVVTNNDENERLAFEDLQDSRHYERNQPPRRRVRFLLPSKKKDQVVCYVPSIDDMTDEERDQAYMDPNDVMKARFDARSITMYYRSNTEIVQMLDTTYSEAVRLSCDLLFETEGQSTEQSSIQFQDMMEIGITDIALQCIKEWPSQHHVTGRGLERYISNKHKKERTEFATQSRQTVVRLSRIAIASSDQIAALYEEYSRSAVIYARMMGIADEYAATTLDLIVSKAISTTSTTSTALSTSVSSSVLTVHDPIPLFKLPSPPPIIDETINTTTSTITTTVPSKSTPITYQNTESTQTSSPKKKSKYISRNHSAPSSCFYPSNDNEKDRSTVPQHECNKTVVHHKPTLDNNNDVQSSNRTKTILVRDNAMSHGVSSSSIIPTITRSSNTTKHIVNHHEIVVEPQKTSRKLPLQFHNNKQRRCLDNDDTNDDWDKPPSLIRSYSSSSSDGSSVESTLITI